MERIDHEWKFLVWQRWLRISRRKPVANISADIIVRPWEQKTFSDAVNAIDKHLHPPTKTEVLFK